MKLQRPAMLSVSLWLPACLLRQAAAQTSGSTSIFAPASTPATFIYGSLFFVLVVTGTIFVVVFGLLVYAPLSSGDGLATIRVSRLQIYGSDQLEMAWTVIPVLIVIVLFLTSARVIHAVQDAPRPPGAIEVTVIGHQFWWEYRYPQHGIVTANELHVPVSDPANPTPTFLDTAFGRH